MNTETLLAIVQPYAELLKGLGWTWCVTSNGRLITPVGDPSIPTEIHPALFTRILADVVMEELERWANDRKGVAVCVRSSNVGTWWAQFTLNDESCGDEQPTRLAALLSLLAWTQNNKG